MSKVYFSCPKFTVLLVIEGTDHRESRPYRQAIRGADDRCPDFLGTIPVRWADHRQTPEPGKQSSSQNSGTETHCCPSPSAR